MAQTSLQRRIALFNRKELLVIGERFLVKYRLLERRSAMETRYVYKYQKGRMSSEEIKVVEEGRLNKETVLAKLEKKHGSSVRFVYFYYVS